MIPSRANRNTRARFNPHSVSAISAWLRVPLATVTGSGISSLPDVLSSNPAVQATDTRRPALATSANGYSLADFDGTNMLVWPLVAANNQLVTTGFGLHLIPGDLTSFGDIVDIWSGAGGASGQNFLIQRNAAQLWWYVSLGGTNDANVRVAKTADVLAANTPVHLSFEYNGGAATEADRCVICVDGAPQSLTFAQHSPTAAAMPASLQNRTGNILIGARTNADSPVAGIVARIGPNIVWYSGAMPGVTSGLLTPAARVALSNFERPTV